MLDSWILSYRRGGSKFTCLMAKAVSANSTQLTTTMADPGNPFPRAAANDVAQFVVVHTWRLLVWRSIAGIQVLAAMLFNEAEQPNTALAQEDPPRSHAAF